MQLQRDDIIIRKGILHVLDAGVGQMNLSNELLDMGPDLLEFVRGHIFKLLDSDDNKEFSGEKYYKNTPHELLESLTESNDQSFIETSQSLAEDLFDIMCDSVMIPSADLLIVSFQIESQVHLALLKMNYKEFYSHRFTSDDSVNDVVMQKVMPKDSSRLTEALIINLTTKHTYIIEKKYEMLSGDKCNYLSELFLRCTAGLSAKKKYQVLQGTVMKVSNSSIETLRDRMDYKSKVYEKFIEDQAFNVHDIGDELFGNNAENKNEFDKLIENYDIQNDTIEISKESTVKSLQTQHIITDAGVEIKIPMEEFLVSSNIEITENMDGTTNITIKDIENVTLK